MEGVVSLHEEKNEDILIIRFKGRLDALSTPETEKKVLNFINRGEYKLVLNFAGVDYISSAGMRMLLAITKKLKPLSGQMILCCITTNVMDVFKISGFDHVLNLSQSEKEAIDSFDTSIFKS